jgi:hypothetical protein
MQYSQAFFVSECMARRRKLFYSLDAAITLAWDCSYRFGLPFTVYKYTHGSGFVFFYSTQTFELEIAAIVDYAQTLILDCEGVS